MFCRNCGKELKDDWIFCDECGIRINPSSEQGNGAQYNAFREKEYNFKTFFAPTEGNPGMIDLIFMIPKIIKGVDMKFFVCENMLVILQKQKYNYKVTAIPYNEIQSFEMKNKFSILTLIFMIIFAVIIIKLMFAFLETFLILFILLIFLMVYMGIFIFTSQIKIKVSDGRKFYFSLKFIKKKNKSLKNEFVSEINKMTSQNPALQNISKQQSKIVIGFTKENLKGMILDAAGDILDEIF